MIESVIQLTNAEQNLIDLLDKYNLILRLREAVAVKVYQIHYADLKIVEIPIFLKHNNKFVRATYPGVIHSVQNNVIWDQLLSLLNSIDDYRNTCAYMKNRHNHLPQHFNVEAKFIGGVIRPALLVSYNNQVFLNSKDSNQHEIIKIAEFFAMDNKEKIKDETFFRFAVNHTLSDNKSVFFNFKIKENEFLEDAFLELSRIIWDNNTDWINTTD